MMDPSPSDTGNDLRRVALYARVSTEDQAERQTVQGQLDFLREFCRLYNLVIADAYVDDGWSGAIALGQRPDGRRLLADAKAHHCTEVLVYRLDRLGRSLKSLLDADAELEAAGVTIRSATEPFDTSSPIGRFVFQLLGSIAELERETITERTMLGRARAVREGKWTNGPIPWGYDLDAEKRLVPSERMVPSLDITEAELVRDLFRRMAAGSTLRTEALRLTALGIPVVYRTLGGGQRPAAKEWRVGRLYSLISNPLYRGSFVMKMRGGGRVEGPMPGLVSPELWDAANRAMARNKSLSTRNAKESYLLRGLIKCACGMGYSGTVRDRGSGRGRYYRCNGQLSSNRVRPEDRCQAKMVDANYIEGLVWEDIRSFVLNPGAALEQARAQLESRRAQTPDVGRERRTVEQQLEAKDTEKARVLALYRRGRIDLPETEHELDTINKEGETLRGMLAALSAQEEMAQSQVKQLDDAEHLAELLRDRLAQVDQEGDWEMKRQLVELLVERIKVESEGAGRGKRATVSIDYAFMRPTVAVDTDAWSGS